MTAPTLAIRSATEADLAAVAALNDASLPAVSEMTAAAWRGFLGMVPYFRVADGPDGGVAAFLVGMVPGHDYDSLNYAWFSAAYDDFVYVDRIVVGEGLRGTGIGRALYEDFARFGRSRGAPVMTAEVNSRPPNPGSMAFHDRMGFRPVGEQETEGGKKAVVLLAKDL